MSKFQSFDKFIHSNKSWLIRKAQSLYLEKYQGFDTNIQRKAYALKQLAHDEYKSSGNVPSKTVLISLVETNFNVDDATLEILINATIFIYPWLSTDVDPATLPAPIVPDNPDDDIDNPAVHV